MAQDTKILMIHETVLKLIVRNAVDFFMAFLFIGLGVFLASEAMQWVGAALFFLCLFGKASNYAKGRMKTPQQAADWLKSEFGVTAKEGE